MDASRLIREQLGVCLSKDVEVLCCPETIVGGLRTSRMRSRRRMWHCVSTPASLHVLSRPPPLDGDVGRRIHRARRSRRGINSVAVIAGGGVVGVYRKTYPAYHTMVRTGRELPILSVDATRRSA